MNGNGFQTKNSEMQNKFKNPKSDNPEMQKKLQDSQNKQTGKMIAEVASKSANPYAKAAGTAVKALDKVSGGKASQAVGKAVSNTPAGKAMNAAKKLSENSILGKKIFDTLSNSKSSSSMKDFGGDDAVEENSNGLLGLFSSSSDGGSKIFGGSFSISGTVNILKYGLIIIGLVMLVYVLINLIYSTTQVYFKLIGIGKADSVLSATSEEDIRTNGTKGLSDNGQIMQNTQTSENGATYINGILLVNKQYPLSKEFGDNLCTDATSSECLEENTKNAYKEMYKAAQNSGISLPIVSGHRNYEYQSKLYERYVARDGEKKAYMYSAKPGYSEHQTGLSMDLVQASDSFTDTSEDKWLRNNAHKYGFILRFPKGKEHITGYKYESWHYRYVGKEHASIIHERGVCLEEYLGVSNG